MLVWLFKLPPTLSMATADGGDSWWNGANIPGKKAENVSATLTTHRIFQAIANVLSWTHQMIYVGGTYTHCGILRSCTDYKIAGINMYEAQCRDKIDRWEGFDIVTAA